jgi:general secretion pathway protein F
VLRHLVARLREGCSLSQALRAQGLDAVLVGVVQAAEGSGSVPAALGRYLAYRQRLDALRQQVGNAVLYPAILLAVGALVTAFLLGYVVPRFALVVQGSARELPWASQALMSAGLWLSAHAAVVAPCAAAGAALAAWRLRRAWRTDEGLVWLARLPGLGPRLGTLVLARFYLTLGLLLEGGIAIQAALTLAGQALDAPRRPGLRDAGTAVATGERLSSALQAAGLCTPVALRLLRAGEHTGQLGGMLARAAAFHDSEAAHWIERFSKAFEPLLMAAIGLVVGVIVILLYLPIFDLASNIG